MYNVVYGNILLFLWEGKILCITLAFGSRSFPCKYDLIHPVLKCKHKITWLMAIDSMATWTLYSYRNMWLCISDYIQFQPRLFVLGMWLSPPTVYCSDYCTAKHGHQDSYTCGFMSSLHRYFDFCYNTLFISKLFFTYIPNLAMTLKLLTVLST